MRWQLAMLARHFPESKGLAVTREMAEQYESELVEILRFNPGSSEKDFVRSFPVEEYATFTARRLPLNYRDRHLVCVEPRTA